MAIFYLNLVLVYVFSLFSRWFPRSASGRPALPAGQSSLGAPLLSALPTAVRAPFLPASRKSAGSQEPASVQPSPLMPPSFPRPNLLFAFLAAVTLVLVSGLRKNIGDTVFYMHSYADMDYSWANIAGKKDLGFNIFQMLLQMVSHDPQILVFTVALATNVLVIVTLYKYAKLFELGLYVYITSGMFLTSMNGIRQFLAAAITFAATKYLFSGDWKKYMLAVLLAAQIHQSAYILIPIYFIVRRKAWSWTTMLLLAGAIFIVIGFNQFTAALFTVLENSQYADYKNFAEGGANIIRVAVSGVPLLFAYLGREKLRSLFPQSDYVVNMTLLAFVFMIISTQNWIFARMTFYFGLYSVLLLSWVVPLFVAKQQKLIYYAIFVSYFIYYFYENVISLKISYESNFIKF